MFTFLTAIVIFLINIQTRFGENIDWATLKPDTCFGDDNYTLIVTDKPLKVFVGISIIDLFDVSEDKMEFGLQTSIYDVWKPTQFKVDKLTVKDPVDIPVSIAKCIWKPDLIFLNSKESHLFDRTIPNTVLKVIPDGYILRYSRYRLKISCQMRFHNYPMDTQKCEVLFSLLTSTIDTVSLHWFGEEGAPPFISKKDQVRVYEGASPLQFAMGKPRLRSQFRTRITGNSSILKCQFKFVRHIAASVINTYIPSSLVVSLSWVSFWIDPSAVPGRVTLGVTALLTLATEIVHARSILPPVNYMTAMDVWLFACLLMVFSSLIEFTLAYSYTQRPKSSTGRVSPSAWSTNTEKEFESSPPQTSNSETVLCKDCMAKSQKQGWTLLVVLNAADRLVKVPNGSVFQNTVPPAPPPKTNSFDLVSRFLFPLVLLIFGIVYWSFYGSKMENIEDLDFEKR